MTRSAVLIVVFGLAACSTRPLGDGDGGGAGDDSGTEGDTATSEGGSGPVTPPPPPVSTTGPADTAGEEESTGEDDGFITPPDGGGHDFECDLHAQNCGPGFKCVPVSATSTWDGTRCVPVVEEPQGIDDPCVVEDPATGVDDCGWGQYCQRTDSEGNGVCVGLCLLEDPESGREYYCEDPEALPAIGCQDCFCVCVNPCHPLEQDCPEGQGCYAVSNGWECAPDASDGMGNQNDGCEFLNGCAPGLLCLNSEIVPGCDSKGPGCCSAACDVEQEPDPCPDQDLGVGCVTWYEKGTAPPGYESVGVCIAP